MSELAKPQGEQVNSSRLNFIGGAIAYAVVVLLTLGVRTVFAKQLGENYLGLNAVLLNAMALVSVAEAGIATAVMFRLYKPLAQGDQDDARRWLAASRRIYRLALYAILAIGSASAFLIPLVTSDLPFKFWTVVAYSSLAVLGTAATCAFATEKALLLAGQKNYVVAGIQAVIVLAQAALQILFLHWQYAFAAFLIIQGISVLVWNFACRVWAKRIYPRPYFDGGVEAHHKAGLREDVRNLLPYKLGAVGLNATDSILISVVLRAALAGLVSNYSLIINAINGILMQGFNGLAAAIGIHSVQSDREQRTNIFFQLSMLSVWSFGVATVCLVVLLDQFVALWLGPRFVLGPEVVVALACVFYITGINQVPSLYRTSLGIFRQTRWVPLAAAILNILVSVVLAWQIGLIGIFLGTILARLLTFNLVDPILVSRASLAVRPLVVFARFALASLGVLVTGSGAIYLRNEFFSSSIWGFVVLAPSVLLFASVAIGAWLCLDSGFRQLLGRVAGRLQFVRARRAGS